MDKKVKTIVLLDLNSTLAVKTGLNTYNWTYDVSKDEYSQELVKELMARDFDIHIVTARPERYQEATLAKIAAETDLILDKVVFKPNSSRKPVHEFKQDYLQSLLDSGVSLDNIIAVESNTNTHRTYKALGLKRVWKRDVFLNLCKDGEFLVCDN